VILIEVDHRPRTRWLISLAGPAELDVNGPERQLKRHPPTAIVDRGLSNCRVLRWDELRRAEDPGSAIGKDDLGRTVLEVPNRAFEYLSVVEVCREAAMVRTSPFA
jgi:hypothetical protein